MIGKLAVGLVSVYRCDSRQTSFDKSVLLILNEFGQFWTAIFISVFWVTKVKIVEFLVI